MINYNAITRELTGLVVADPSILFDVAFVESGSATSSAPTGIPVILDGFEITLGNIDSIDQASTSGVGGFETGVPINVVLDAGSNSLLESGGFLSPVGVITAPAGFDFFRLQGSGVDSFASQTEATPNGNPQNAITATFDSGSGFRFVYGQTGQANNSNANSFSLFGGIDSDLDGIVDHLDIDSDNDGITDNVEAQTTACLLYTSPSPRDRG